MSLFSTIAHDGAVPARGFSLKGIGMMAAGLALGVTVGFVIGTNGTAAEPSVTPAATVTGLAYDDFVRLNTTDLDGLVPAASAKAIESPAVVDPFIEMNTTSFDGLVPVAAANGEKSGNASEEFQYWNIASLEYPAARHSQQSSGPR